MVKIQSLSYAESLFIATTPRSILTRIGWPCLGSITRSNRNAYSWKHLCANGGALPLYRDAVSVFCSPNWLVQLKYWLLKYLETKYKVLRGLKCLWTSFHRHHVVPPARISLTLSRHSSLSFIASGRSYIPYPHRAAVCRFELVVLLFHSRMRRGGSIEEHHS